MKKTLAAVMALVMAFMLVACGASEAQKNAAGTYNFQKGKFVGDSDYATDEDFTLKLNEDGTGTRTTDGISYDLTWKLDGETFTMSETFLGLTNDYTGTLKDGELDIFNGDPTNDFTYEYVLVKEYI